MAHCTCILRVLWNLSLYMQQIVLDRFFPLYKNYIYMCFINLSKIIFLFIVFDVHIFKNHDPLSYSFLHHFILLERINVQFPSKWTIWLIKMNTMQRLDINLMINWHWILKLFFSKSATNGYFCSTCNKSSTYSIVK